MSYPTQDEIRELLHYDKETGLFWWKKSGPGRCTSTPAGTIQKSGSSKGYVKITIRGKRHRAHALAWLYVHGSYPPLIDHKDGNPSNNAIDNLRPTTQSMNAGNSRLSSRNTSGHKGVSWDKERKKWMACIRTEHGTHRTIGRFDDKLKASDAYRKAALERFGDFSRLR